jgi:hypothetical protein
MFRDDLFAQPAGRTIEPVETPAGRTFIRSLMAGEKDRFDIAAAKSGEFRARLVQASCCTEAGQLEFTEADLHRINDLPLHLIEPIVDAAIRLNKIGPGDAEVLRKN